MSVKELAKVSGAHPTTIKGWLARAPYRRRKRAGREAPRSAGRGACRKLTLAAEAWIRDQIVKGNPQQIKLPFALWTRPAIRALIRDHFGADLQERLMGKYLKRWGFTPQRPVKRALEQNPEVVRQWLEQDYPPPARASGPRGSGDLLGGRDGRQGRCPLGARVCASGTNAGIGGSRPMG
ncbi:winged helix-turn-helix domain-containing protein, partial [Acidithiobacillus thiooxidans]|uniref:winged helix-turn-helix domain-containing protein n=1 Tax=Acidithiobacillus thiooxidans TaxID=930 RepID=UPI001ED9A85C